MTFGGSRHQQVHEDRTEIQHEAGVKCYFWLPASALEAAYYKERLSRLLEGKTEPPPDPGRYDPVTGGSEAQGAESES